VHKHDKERQRNAPGERFDIPPTERKRGRTDTTENFTTEGSPPTRCFFFHFRRPSAHRTKRQKQPVDRPTKTAYNKVVTIDMGS